VDRENRQLRQFLSRVRSWYDEPGGIMAKARKLKSRRHGRDGSRRRRKSPPGLPPGTFIGDPQAPAPTLQLFLYDGSTCEERTGESLQALEPLTRDGRFLWLHVEGLGNVEIIRAIAERFGLHHLAVEDVLNGGQRPKVEPYDGQLFLVCHALEAEQGGSRVQLSLFLLDGALVSFAEAPVPALAPVQQRLREGKGRMRSGGPGYLGYALIDTVVDSYYGLVESIEARLDRLEESVLRTPEAETLEGIHGLRSELLHLKRSLWPLREVLAHLQREPGGWFQESTLIYLRDCHDHVVQILDLLDGARETASNLMGVYMSQISNRMNEVMKFLTLIATIFIPLGFIAGVYGMNFSSEASFWNMPELSWRFGYPFALGLMGVVAVAFLAYFWRKGWFR
jgi:magnesium transporter